MWIFTLCKWNWLRADGSEAVKFLRYLYCSRQAKIYEPQAPRLARNVSKSLRRQDPEHLVNVQLRKVIKDEQLPSRQRWGHGVMSAPVYIRLASDWSPIPHFSPKWECLMCSLWLSCPCGTIVCRIFGWQTAYLCFIGYSSELHPGKIERAGNTGTAWDFAGLPWGGLNVFYA